MRVTKTLEILKHLYKNLKKNIKKAKLIFFDQKHILIKIDLQKMIRKIE